MRLPRAAALGTLLLAATLAATLAARPAAAQGCALECRRADTMWDAWGRPDGNLGTESVAVSPDQRRVFNTDWRYEKQRNDGTTYYGSHLRVATNASPVVVRLLVRTTDLTGLENLVRTGTNTYWVSVFPGATQQFKADLLEVGCIGEANKQG